MADTSGAARGQSNGTPQVEKGWGALKKHVIDNKVNVALLATRIFTILFTIGYLIPLFGNPYNAYHKVLMSSAATSALRLHQRVPGIQLNTRCLELLLVEDSCHYLLYSLIFLYVAPATVVLVPVFLFAVVHSASYSLTLLDTLGQNSVWQVRLLVSIVEFQSRTILRLCALCEIIILPLTIILVFSGRAGLLTPFIYYQFLWMRLSSMRNPSTRNIFREIRNALSSAAVSPIMPRILKFLINTLLRLTQHMVPVQAPQQ
ncbi:Krueppel homolog 2 [Diachasmimorpha longicaudata]|uniref:Krueppel homolog 2 n=1 Tax=Diachasmimorpha longicaudata TaxID=58733 RepID=UPI0030B87DFC